MSALRKFTAEFLRNTMGKNQSKEHRKSKENTPERENRRENTETPAPTPRPELKKQSTLQALKHLATPPGLRKSDSTRSKIQWPSSTKRTPSAKTLLQASTQTPIGHEENKENLKPSQELTPSNRGSSTNNRTLSSTQHQTNDSETIQRLEDIAITSPTKSAGPKAQESSPIRGSTPLADNQNNTGSPPQTETAMSPPLKENMRLSPTTNIRSDTMEKSGIYTKPTKGIFDAANKRRKVSPAVPETAKVSFSTSPSTQHNDKANATSKTIFDYSQKCREVPGPENFDDATAGISALSEDGQVVTSPGGTNYRWAEGAMPDWAKPNTPSKKRKSNLLGGDIAEEMRAKSKQKLMPEDFEKLAEYGMFNPGALCIRREGVPIPYQILEHIKIYYEEGLCESLHYFLRHTGPDSCPFLIPPFVSRQKPTQGTVKHATKLLNCICVSGRGDDTPNAPPAFVPPPSYIALLTTVMIHPSFTTDVENGKEARDNMIHATNTLLNILDAVGPKQANMKAAFQFAQGGYGGGRGSRTGRTKRYMMDDSQSNPEDEVVSIGHPLAQEESVWTTATDLWHVVGWALNCSINHKERWQFYQAWLKVVAYAIDDDMEDCKDKWREAEFDPIAQGILGRTIIDPDIPTLSKTIDMKSALKRAVAACFANGKDQSLKQFPEVWKDELNPAARADKEDESAGGQKIFTEVPTLPPTIEDIQELRQQPYSAPTDEETKIMREKAAASFGGIKALDMRCSFLARLLDFDYHVFGRKKASQDIYQIICDHIVNLPLATFTVFLSHFSTFTPRGSAASLLQCCANRLIDTKAPHDPNQDGSYDLPIMIKCYLPFAANTSTPEDNAKLSYCIDSMVRFYPHFDGKDTFDADQDYGCTRQELETAIALGTYTRLTKCQNYKPKARNAKELEYMMETQEHRHHMIRIAGEKMHAYVHNYYFKDSRNPDHVDKKACAGFLDGITTFADLESENAIKWTGEI